MFQFGGFPAYDYFIHHMLHVSSTCGFPHSEIRGLALICSSPRLIAACHVLLRLLMPRHSPYALFSLNSFFDMFSHILVLSCLKCCVSRFQLLFRFGKIVLSYPFFGKTVFVFLWFFVPVRVLLLYSVFNDHCALALF